MYFHNDISSTHHLAAQTTEALTSARFSGKSEALFAIHGSAPSCDAPRTKNSCVHVSSRRAHLYANFRGCQCPQLHIPRR